MKRLDIVIIALFLCIGFVGLFFIFSFKTPGEKVRVYHKDELFGEYSLADQNIISINDGDKHNTIVIENGICYMSESNCSNRICVHEGIIKNNNESIYCAPNDIYIVIESENDGEYDAITR